MDASKQIEQINAMSKTDFHEQILRSIAACDEFTRLVSIGIGFLTPPEKQHLCNLLTQSGIRLDFSDSPDIDEALEQIAFAITTRAVRVI